MKKKIVVLLLVLLCPRWKTFIICIKAICVVALGRISGIYRQLKLHSFTEGKNSKRPKRGPIHLSLSHKPHFGTFFIRYTLSLLSYASYDQTAQPAKPASQASQARLAKTDADTDREHCRQLLSTFFRLLLNGCRCRCHPMYQLWNERTRILDFWQWKQLVNICFFSPNVKNDRKLLRQSRSKPR